MMLSKCGRSFLVGMICMLFPACQMLPDEELTADGEGTLNVRTRSAASVEIAYPVYLYAFSKEGKCIESQEIEDESKEAQIRLPADAYRVVAVSGVSDAYALPADPELTDVILLEAKEGAETPLLVGKADVVIDKDTDATLEVTLSYVVTAVQVMLTNVPADVSAVSMTLSSFHTSLSMDGVYGGEPQELEISCTQTSDQVWSSNTVYVFPGSSQETVFSILLKKKDGTTLTYGYTWKDAPKANQPLRITGNYSAGLAVSGHFVVKDWDTAVDVDFEFGGVMQEDQEDEDDEVEVECSSIPELGSVWYDCIVADVGEYDGEGVDILLMSLDEWFAPVGDVPALIEGYAVNELTNWRLPTDEEAKRLRDNFHGESLDALNDKIADHQEESLGIDVDDRYLCLKGEKYYSYMFVENKSVALAGVKKSYKVRLVNLCYLMIDE